MTIKRCDKCNYEWLSRVEDPVACPDCKSRDWDKDKEEENEK